MTIITDEHMRAAEQDSEAAQTIIFAAECAMIAQGRQDPFDVVTALRDFANIVDRSVVEH